MFFDYFKSLGSSLLLEIKAVVLVMGTGFLTCYNSHCLSKSVARDMFKITHIMVAG